MKASGRTAVKREKFAKNKKNTSKERLSLSLFKVWYFTERAGDTSHRPQRALDFLISPFSRRFPTEGASAEERALGPRLGSRWPSTVPAQASTGNPSTQRYRPATVFFFQNWKFKYFTCTRSMLTDLQFSQSTRGERYGVMRAVTLAKHV